MKKIINSILVRLHPIVMFLFRHQLIVSVLLLVLAFVIAYCNYPRVEENNMYADLPQFLGAFFNAFVDPGDSLKNVWLFFAQFIAFLAFSIVVLAGLFRDSLTKNFYKTIAGTNHSLVVGLGENNRVYLDSEYQEKQSNKIIIIEPDANNPHIESYKEKGFGVFVGTIEDFTINFTTLEKVIISAGDDRLNIDIVGEIKSKLDAQLDAEKLDITRFGCKTTIYVHLSNQNYKTIFHNSILDPKKIELPFEYRTFSYEDAAARSLFMQDTVLGNKVDTLMHSDEEFSVIVVGNGALAERVVYHLVMMASLPYHNKLNLYLYSQDSTAFIEKLRTLFFNFDSKISNLELYGKDINFDRPQSWDSNLWTEQGLKNLTQIYICDDNESSNLQTALTLHDRFYLDAKDESRKTKRAKVNFAMYHNLALSETINYDQNEFKDFYSFGDARKIFNKKSLIDEQHEKVAKLIHHGYGEKLSNSVKHYSNEELETKWLKKTKFGDRESNRSQALHMHTKLEALRINVDYEDKLYSLPIDSDKETYRDYLLGVKEGEPSYQLDIDKDAILKKFEELGGLVHKLYNDVEAKINDVEAKIIDTIFKQLTDDNSLLSKLIIAEHERWNRFHFLNGWQEVPEGKKNKELKKHDCLKPLKEFNAADKRMTILYDLYSVLYLDFYLEEIGFTTKSKSKTAI